MTERDPPSPNRFEKDKPGTNARTAAESRIEALRQEGGVFVEAVRATRMPMAITDPGLPGNPIVFANQSFLDLSGYGMKEVLGQQPYFMNGPDTDPEDAERFRRILEEDRDGVVETIQYSKGGRRFVATVLLSAFKDDSGATLHHFLSWADVTERVDAEADAAGLRTTHTALRESEGRYRTLFESIDEGYCVVEVLFDRAGGPIDYRFLEANPAFENQTGLADAVGKTMRSLAPDHEQFWFDAYGRIARSGRLERFEHRADALGRWYEVYAFPIGAPELRRVGILFRDVIDRKRAEQELAQSNHLLQTTVDSSLQIIQLFRAVRDEQGELVDFEWLLTNKQWDDRWGSNTGKRLLTENPAVAESGIWDKFLQVMESGEPITHEHYYPHEQFDGWFLQTIAKANDGILLSTLDITDRKRAELALREKEEKYRSLFETMGQGYCELELVRGSDGRAVDQLYLELNPAFERLFGVPVAQARGRKASELFPNLEHGWTEAFDRVAKTGRRERIEQPVGDRWFEVFATPRAGDRVAVLYEEVTERKRAEAALRESEERQAYLLQLSDALRSLTDAVEIIGAATRLLGEGLGASRTYYAEWPPGTDYVEIRSDYFAPGLPSLVGRYPIEFFRSTDERFREGRTWVIQDASDGTIPAAERDYCLAHGVAAWVDVPLVKDGKLQAALFLVQDSPRCWNATEIALAEETAERTWAALERARAEDGLRQSEERFRLIVENARDYGIFTTDTDGRITQWYEGAAEVFGWSAEEAVGNLMDMTFTPEDRANGEPRKERDGAAQAGWVPNVRWHMRKDGRRVFVEGIASGLRDPSGALTGFLKIGQDVTERRRSEEHQKTLLAELQHRVRNTLGIVRSIARRTAQTSETVEEMASHLAGRLDAFSRVQAAVTRNADGGVDLASMIEDELLAHAARQSERVTVKGPDVCLKGRGAESVSLAIHELTSNAVKYGALSASKGRLTVSWARRRAEGGEQLILRWEESGLDTVLETPDRQGFGMELLLRSLPYDLRAETDVEFRPEGLCFTMKMPLGPDVLAG